MPIENAADLLEQSNYAEGLSDPSLAMNVNGIADWTPQMAFLDLSKTMRGWFTRDDDGYHFFDDLEESLSLDQNGWLTEIPDGIDAVSTVWDWHNVNHTESAVEDRAGTYVLQYEGEGTLELYGNAAIIAQEDGKIVFENASGGSFGFRITETDPNNTGEYIRDISVVREDHLDLWEAGATFNPKWVELVADLTQIRFMDWMGTNGSTQSEISDRPPADYFSYSAKGVPIEVIVELGNQLGTDIWINIPHLATDDYIETLATYVHENLDPNLKVTVEYSNEVWNSAFGHSHEVAALADVAFPGVEPSFGTRLDYYGMRASQTMKIFTDVFGDDIDQLVRVAGTQYVNTWVTERILNAPSWQETNPDEYVAPSTYFDAIAVTTYFGGALTTNDDLLAEVIDAVNDPSIDAFEYVAEMLRDPDVNASIPQVEASLHEQAAVAEEYGLSLVAYEGGQHAHHLFATDGEGEVLSEFFTEFIRSEQMADLYQELWDVWQRVGGEAFMQFTDVGSPSKWGSWGIRSTLSDTNPRSELLDDLNAANPAWWQDRGGEHFQQGIALEGDASDNILVGTNQEDFLVGADGNDTFVGGAGDDGVHGGAGDDVLLVRGTQADYNLSIEGDAYRLEGADGSDRLVSIETIEFEDGTLLALAPLGEPDPTDNETPTDTTPLEVRNYIFGHSLINHDSAAETAVPYWLQQLAEAGGNTYGFSGQYGFLPQHDNLPPTAQWGFDGVPTIWDNDTGQSFADVDFTAVTITAGNFIQYKPANESYDGDNPNNDSPLSATLSIIDWVTEQEPGVHIYIYENWPDMAPFVSDGPFNPSAEEFLAYNNNTLTEFHHWWVDYVTELQAKRPDIVIEMIPVGPTISKLLMDESLNLNQIPITELYSDNAPHGTETTYFLASLINYAAVYDQRPPADMEIPEIIHDLVRDNYADIVEFIWNEVAAYDVPNDGPNSDPIDDPTEAPGEEPDETPDETPDDPPTGTGPEIEGEYFVGAPEAQAFVADDITAGVSYESATTGVFVDLARGVGRNGEADSDTYDGIQNIVGYDGTESEKGDWLRGNDADNALHGLGGNDALFGGLGADTLSGGEGWDYTSYASSDSAVSLNLMSGINTGGEAEGDALAGLEGIWGSNHNDSFKGGTDEVYFSAGDGDDTITIGSGDLSADGGAGADTFVFTNEGIGHLMTIKNFSLSDGDALDLTAFSLTYNPESDNISDYLKLTEEPWGTYLAVDTNGGGDNFVPLALLRPSDGALDLTAMEETGSFLL